MRYRKLTGLIGMLLLAALLCGCSDQAPLPAGGSNPVPANGNASVTVAVTRDSGKVILLEETVAIEEGSTALDALHQVAEVRTKYGGGFVDAINGISSEYEGGKQKKDWLFYINGISPSIGADDYIIRDGNIEHWDFRDWSYQQYIPAIIGDFPQPFLGGYRGEVWPTVIVHDAGLEEYARALAERLHELGVAEVAAWEYSQLSQAEKEKDNLIMLGTKDNELIAELNAAHKKLGFYAYFNEDKLVVLNAQGEVAAGYGAGSGLIQATQNPWHPKGVGTGENVVWMVSGVDEAGVRNAADTLLNGYADLKYAYAVAVAEGMVIRVPP